MKLVDSVWKSEKVFEPEGGKLDGLKDVVSSALSNTMEDYNGLEAIPDLEDDLTEPSKSTSKVKKNTPIPPNENH